MSLSQGQDQDPSIRLYAELLPNIRQVTLYVSLPISPNNPDTCNNGSSDSSIVLSSDYRRITVAHNKKTAKLNLPAQVSETSRERLGFNNEQKNKGGETSFRLHIDNQQKTEGGGGQGRGHEANEEDEDEVDGVPWSAATLGSETRLRCRQCQNILLRSRLELDDDLSLECGEESSRGKKGSNGRIFKDLPSQNWAEMMDFWHCHKPDEPGHNHGHEHTHGDSGAHQDPKMAQDQNGTVKGYGASNRVVATPGTVLVDVSSFVVAEEDGVGLNKVSLVYSLFPMIFFRLLRFQSLYPRSLSHFYIYYLSILAHWPGQMGQIRGPFLLSSLIVSNIFFLLEKSGPWAQKEGGLITLASSPHQGDSIPLRFGLRYNCPRAKTKNQFSLGAERRRRKMVGVLNLDGCG